MSEEWRPVVGFEGRYEVSDRGNMRSLRHKHGPRSAPRPMKLKPHSRGYGHVRIELTSGDGVVTTRGVHALVLEAFGGGPCPPGHECAHLDGDPTNNTPANLMWATRAENQSHKILHETSLRGEASNRAKLTDEQAAQVRRLASDGVATAAIAARFGLSTGHVRKLARGVGRLPTHERFKRRQHP